MSDINCGFMIDDAAPAMSTADFIWYEMRELAWTANVLLGFPTLEMQRWNECRERHGKLNCLCRFCISERVGLDPYRRRD